jgi:DNA-binding Lrp family transcriptional regulator
VSQYDVVDALRARGGRGTQSEIAETLSGIRPWATVRETVIRRDLDRLVADGRVRKSGARGNARTGELLIFELSEVLLPSTGEA